jgi:hypothetical protein
LPWRLPNITSIITTTIIIIITITIATTTIIIIIIIILGDIAATSERDLEGQISDIVQELTAQGHQEGDDASPLVVPTYVESVTAAAAANKQNTEDVNAGEAEQGGEEPLFSTEMLLRRVMNQSDETLLFPEYAEGSVLADIKVGKPLAIQHHHFRLL